MTHDTPPIPLFAHHRTVRTLLERVVRVRKSAVVNGRLVMHVITERDVTFPEPWLAECLVTVTVPDSDLVTGGVGLTCEETTTVALSGGECSRHTLVSAPLRPNVPKVDYRRPQDILISTSDAVERRFRYRPRTDTPRKPGQPRRPDLRVVR